MSLESWCCDPGYDRRVTGGALIREARLRAGLSQGELGERIGRDRTQVARWERDVVSPSFDVVMEIVAICGFDLQLELQPSIPIDDAVIREWVELSPQERIERALREASGG
jgi:transcriptional regulator with XRE-family HTH domain